ncbi:MAG: FecR domain-containing protein [Candidatus Methanoperedens sp.]|nr:FecR domain-containing protein [Candidatus Methanoperedens sp.]
MILKNGNMKNVQKVCCLFIMYALAFSLTIQPVLGDTFPAAEFNGLQITYSVSGASITSTEDKVDFTTSRTLKGTLGTGNLMVSGSAKASPPSCGGGFYSYITVSVWVDGNKKTYTAPDPVKCESASESYSFSLSVPIPAGANEGGFIISETYVNPRFGDRGLDVSGTFGGTPVPPTPVVTTTPVPPTPVSRIDSGARFSGISGQVEIRPDNDPNGWRLAKPETIIYVDDHIKTDEDSTAIIGFADMSTFVMKRDTEVVVSPPSGQDSKLKLIFGRIWVNFKKTIRGEDIYGNEDDTYRKLGKYREGMEVELTQADLGIKGTIFALEETGSASTLKVADGSVQITHKITGENLTIYAGEKVTAGKRGFGSIQRFDAESELAELEKEIPGSSRLMEKITSTQATGAIKEIFTNTNIGAVYNSPTSPTTFTLDDTYKITTITTYHWNDGSGAYPGTIGLKDSRGNKLGTWTATGRAGQGGVSNAYWDVTPDIVLAPGTYTIIDSDSSTWSQNSESNNQGIAWIKGVNQTSVVTRTPTPKRISGDFTVEISPMEMTVNPGDSMRFTLTVVPEGDFNEPVEIYVKIDALGQEKNLGRVKIINPPYKPYVFESAVPGEIPKGTTITGYVTAKGGGLERDAGTVTVNVPGFEILLAIGALGMAILLRKRR